MSAVALALPAPPPLAGQYEVTRDDRGRVAIPARLYYAFAHASEAMVGPAPSGDSLYILPPAVWEALVNRLAEAKALGDREAAAFERFYTMLYRREKLSDTNRRVEIAPRFNALAELGPQVMVVGRTDRLQVFSLDKWGAFQTHVLTDIRPLADSSPWA